MSLVVGQPLVHGRCAGRHDDTTKTFISLFDGLVPVDGDRASRGGRSEGEPLTIGLRTAAKRASAKMPP
jgi:hypothetical protein